MSETAKFLIVDSKTTRRHSIQNLFFSLDYETKDIKGVSSAEEVLDLLKNHTYLAAFISTAEAYDWIELIGSIREFFDYDTLPIIVLSEMPTEQTVVTSYTAGANGFLLYPCSVENIAKVIKVIEAPKEEINGKRKITT